MLFRWAEFQFTDYFSWKEDFQHPGHELLISGGEDDDLEGIVIQDVCISGHNSKNYVCNNMQIILKQSMETYIFSKMFLRIPVKQQFFMRSVETIDTVSGDYA